MTNYKIQAEPGSLSATPTDNDQVKIHRDGQHVVVIHSNGRYMKFPHEAAKQIASAMYKVSLAIEEETKALLLK